MDKKQEEIVKKATKTWGKCLRAYQDLRVKHQVFCKAAEEINLDFAGPGLREALQRLFHRRNFSMFMEDLLYEDHRKGGVSQLVPPKESTGKQDGLKFS